MANVQAIDALLVKVHDRLAEAMRIPTIPWPDPAAHGHEATGRAIHASYCAMRFKLMDAIAELTAARCAITAALTDGVNPCAEPFTAKAKGIVAGDGQPCPNDHDPDCRWPECLCRTRGVRVVGEPQGEK